MKKFIKKTKKLIKNPDFILILISLVVFVIGGITLNWIVSFIAVGFVDLLLFLPKIRKKGKRKKMPKSKKQKIIKITLIVSLSVIIILLLLASLFFYMIIKKAPEFNPEKLYQKEASILYMANGEIIDKLGAQKRENITYDQVSEVLINAVVATEDSRFFQHSGFDLFRFLKASFYQALGKRDAGGASTLTMQLSKQYYTSTEAKGIEGITRKFTDIYMSMFKIEKKYTKQQILEFYLNSNYLGAYKYGGAYGVEQACLTYFGKSAKDVNLAEAALIAGLFNAPGYLDPYSNPEGAEARRKVVLSLMERHGYISNEERLAAEAVTVDKLIIEHETVSSEYQGFIDTVVEEIISLYGEQYNPYVKPMLIYTTMDKDKQDHVNKIVKGETFSWENDAVNAGISVVDVNNGAIIAVGTGRKSSVRGLNYATLYGQTKKQIGSTAKPFYDYGPGIEYNNWSTYTPFTDEEHTYSSGTKVSNWDGKYYGFMTLRTALIESRNIPALKAFQSISNKNIKTFVEGLGLNPQIEGNIVHEAHSIGGYNGESPLSVSAAYAAFANGGYYIKPYSFTKIVLRENNEELEQKPKKERAMSESTAYMITDVLVDTAKSALGAYTYVNGKPFAAKTGTTNFPEEAFKQLNLPSNAINDLWVAGYNTEYSIAVWYGYDPVSKDNVTKFGNFNHAKLFQAVAKGIFTSNNNFKQPSDVIEIEIEKESYPAMLPSEFTPDNMRIKELFKKGSEPTEVSSRYKQLDNVSNLNGNVTSNKLTLSWDPIKKPDAIDKDYLTNHFKSLYNKASNQNNYLNSRLSYNNNYIGDLGYNIYIKKDGKLSLIGFTKGNEYTINLDSISSNQTYIVKSSYSIFKSNESKGTEITIELTNSNSIITSDLNGEPIINLKVNDEYVYKELTPVVIVKENALDVPNSQVTIKTTIKRSSDNKEITKNDIKTNQTETFIITYEVSYKNYKNIHERKIIIK